MARLSDASMESPGEAVALADFLNYSSRASRPYEIGMYMWL
ncbi:MAG: hypothetical protein QOJ47_1827 [Gaiellales bacterium]|nr:hypothetical protein [Gaiellales bacterium]